MIRFLCKALVVGSNTECLHGTPGGGGVKRSRSFACLPHRTLLFVSCRLQLSIAAFAKLYVRHRETTPVALSAHAPVTIRIPPEK
jgi:hypothetical protein